MIITLYDEQTDREYCSFVSDIIPRVGEILRIRKGENDPDSKCYLVKEVKHCIIINLFIDRHLVSLVVERLPDEAV